MHQKLKQRYDQHFVQKSDGNALKQKNLNFVLKLRENQQKHHIFKNKKIQIPSNLKQ